MTIDDELNRLEREIDSLDAALGGKEGEGAKKVDPQIAEMFQSTLELQRSLKNLAHINGDKTAESKALSLGARIVALLDKYEVATDAK